MDRKTMLLVECLRLLERQDDSRYVLNLLAEELEYDGVTCDGYCLMNDIKEELLECGDIIEEE